MKMIFFKRLFCDHWYKAMVSFKSAYFINKHKKYVEWEISECKQCGKHKTERLN